MSTVKALAEVLGAVLDALQDRCTTPRCVEEQCALCRSEGPLYERLQDIIAIESAGERLVTNEAGRAAERAQQAPMTATRAQVLTEDIIAAESAAVGVKEFGLRCELRESEKRCALQLETIRELRAENERLLHQLSAASDTFAEGAGAHKRYEEELEALFATHRREIAKLQLESEAHARRAVERAIRVASNLADTASEHWSLLDILGPTDVDRIVKETK